MYWSGFHSASLNGPVPMDSVTFAWGRSLSATSFELAIQAIGGRALAQGRARSKAAEARKTVTSS